MITADQAKEIAKNSRSLNKLDEIIRKSAEKGETQISIEIGIGIDPNEFIPTLKDNGFKVEELMISDAPKGVRTYKIWWY